MRLLLYTNLYPSDEAPRHGVFVAERLRQLLKAGNVDARVCALRPQYSLNPMRFVGVGGASSRQLQSGVNIANVLVPTLPMVTNWIDPLTWARASRSIVRAVIDELGDGVILDAHFLYPDGVAAVILGKHLDIPVVMTARGSDINVKARNPIMRRWILWASRHCAAVIAVSRDLAAKLRLLGVQEEKIHTLANGVDLERFRPVDGSTVRSKYQLTGNVIASVGHLVEGKGHQFAIRALTRLPDVHLLIVGEGPEQRSLEQLALTLGVSPRVRFVGLVPHDEISQIYSASDLTVLASSNEGMPNVVLESIACGTPVVATNVGGISEVITARAAGRIMADRTADALARSAREILDAPSTRTETREFAQRFDWHDTVRQQLSLYEQVAQQ